MERGKLLDVFPIKGHTFETLDEIVMLVWKFENQVVLEVGSTKIGISYDILNTLMGILGHIAQ